MTLIAITGAAGKTGRIVVRHFLDHGDDVLPIDSAGLAGGYGEFSRELGVGLVRADLTDYGQTVDILKGVDAIVHLAAIPAPGLFPDSTTFLENTSMNYNVFAAAQLHTSRPSSGPPARPPSGCPSTCHRATPRSTRTTTPCRPAPMRCPRW